MGYYDALVAKWPTLGAAAVDQTRIDAAKAAFAAPPVEPQAPAAGAGPDIVASYVGALRDYEFVVAQWHLSYAMVFADPAVLTKIAALNAMTVPGPSVPVPVLSVMTYLRSNGLWMPIKMAQTTSPGAAAAVDYNSDPRVQTLDCSLPMVEMMLGDLVTHQLLSQAQSDAIVALGATSTPWWKSAGYSSPIGPSDLEAVFVQTGQVLV